MCAPYNDNVFVMSKRKQDVANKLLRLGLYARFDLDLKRFVITLGNGQRGKTGNKLSTTESDPILVEHVKSLPSVLTQINQSRIAQHS
jgi:hypothetical protein